MIGLAIALVALAGCTNKKEVRAARSSVYDIDFAVVYSGALQATRELYANLDDNPGSGKIMTAWHQVQYANNQDDLGNQRIIAQQQGVQQGGAGVSPGAAAAGMPTRLAYKRYFIRFDVTVAGGRPWRVKVSGHAAEWDPGNAMPTELKGMARPPWLDGRIEALQVAIYRKIKPYAIKAKEEVPIEKTEPDLPKTDPTVFKGVTAPAAKTLAAIKDALAMRDNTALRAQLADDVVWSLGGAPGADTAMAMWQADPESLEAMGRTIAGGCGTVDKKVACPPGAPIPGAYQLVIEPRGDAWKVTSFVKAE
ncbi:MAG: hypothetical protein H0T46_26230 [Deltaproteobacteria bacterium]|nr:hypothetical protein [Deltaproteobacteria bacterium]